MSKEILFDFNTIFWTSIKWYEAYRYITKIKSRIYRASIHQNTKQLHNLQYIIMLSSSTKLLILNYLVSQYVTPINVLTDAERITLIRAIYHKYIGSKDYQKLVFKYKTYIRTIESMQCIVALEPQWYAQYDMRQVNYQYNEANILSAQYLAESFSKTKYNLHVITYHLDSFVRNLNSLYILNRLGKHYNKLTYKFIKNYYDNQSIDQVEYSIQDPLKQLISSIIIYQLILETKYLCMKHSVYIDKKNYLADQVNCFLFGSQLLVYSNHQYILTTWTVYFNEILDNNLDLQSINYSFYNLVTGIIIGEFLVRKISTLSAITIIQPSKLSQYHFLNRIKSIIKTNYTLSTYDLIKVLNPIIHQWRYNFSEINTMKVFITIDYLIYLQIRKSIFQKYKQQKKLSIARCFTYNQLGIYYKTKSYLSKWILYGYKNYQTIILLQLRWKVKIVDALLV